VPFVELVPEEIWTYKYDWNDRLIEVRHNYKTVMTSEYGINGERIRKSENGTDTYYFFPEYEEDWNGDTLIKSAKYHFANGKRIAKENEAGELFYYVGDHLGSMVILDKSENVVKTMKYLPYGGTALESGTHDEDYRFNDKELDATGLYYYGARYYDPSLGRFISADTATPGDGFDPQGLNRYSYCRNNPIKYEDPDGHDFRVKSVLTGFVLYMAAKQGFKAGFREAGKLTARQLVKKGLDGLLITGTTGVICRHYEHRLEDGYGFGESFVYSFKDMIDLNKYAERWDGQDWRKLGFDVVMSAPFGMVTGAYQIWSKAFATSLKLGKRGYTVVNALGNVFFSTNLQIARSLVFTGKFEVDPFNSIVNTGLQFGGAWYTSKNPDSDFRRNVASIGKKVGRQMAYTVSDLIKNMMSGSDSYDSSGVGIGPGLGLEFESNFDWIPDWYIDMSDNYETTMDEERYGPAF
jgi:RHS repeat-associated protein